MSYYINDYNRKTVSNVLIWLSLIFTASAYVHNGLYNFWMNDFFLKQWMYHIYFMQFFTSVFLHWGFFHLFFNSVFVYYFWNQVEMMLGKKKYIIFFLFSIFLIWGWLTMFSEGNTVWISGFCLALLAYFTLELKARRIDEYKWWMTAIVVNLAVWLHPQISLLGHLFGVIAWVIFYYINKNFLKRVLTSVE